MHTLKLIGLVMFSMLILNSCSKPEEGLINRGTPYVAARPLYPQNPLSPQVSVLYPVVTTDTVNGCIVTNWPLVSDTFGFQFKAEPGRLWWGGPTKLTKYRVVVDNQIVLEAPVSGKTKFPITYKVIVPSKSLWNTNFMNDTSVVKWHSLGVTFWQEDGNVGSQGLYCYTLKTNKL